MIKVRRQRYDGAIVTITANNNYGNIMQRWALQTFLKQHGYNFTSYFFYGYYWRKYLFWQSWLVAVPRYIVLRLLGKSHLYVNAPMYNYRHLTAFCRRRINQTAYVPLLHRRYKTYIIGSDQNFNISTIGREFFASWRAFLLGFVAWPARRISYASSFGKSVFTKKDKCIYSNEARHLMQRFDAVAVREPSAVQLARDFWGVDAVAVVDPTLLLQKADYDALIAQPVRPLRATKPLFYYLLRERKDSKKYRFMQSVAERMGVDYEGTTGQGWDQLPPVEQWLRGFADAELVVTNSFHGTIFSIINHTDFITLCATTASGGSVRYADLLRTLGLEDRLIREDQFDQFDVTRLRPIDWKRVDTRLSLLRQESGRWLLSQLEGAAHER